MENKRVFLPEPEKAAFRTEPIDETLKPDEILAQMDWDVISAGTEVEKLLMDEVSKHPDFVFSAVKGDYGKDIVPMYNYVVVIEVPQKIRSQRVRNRSFQKFGSRMLMGGDLYSQEESFFQMVDSRQEDYIESWLQKVNCPIIRVDGTKPIDENVTRIIQEIVR